MKKDDSRPELQYGVGHLPKPGHVYNRARHMTYSCPASDEFILFRPEATIRGLDVSHYTFKCVSSVSVLFTLQKEIDGDLHMERKEVKVLPRMLSA